MPTSLRPHLICYACWGTLAEPYSCGLVHPPHEGCCWCGNSQVDVFGTACSKGVVQCQGVHLHEMEASWQFQRGT